MSTLHELATKLQESIIKQQENAHDSTNLNVSKYNNLKLKMNSSLHYPHVIVIIGISEATYNIKEGTKTDGGLGPDEKYVRKWLSNSLIMAELKEIYIHLNDLVSAEDEEGGNKQMTEEGEADEVKIDAPKINYRQRRGLMTAEELMAMPENNEEMLIDSNGDEADSEHQLSNSSYLESVDDIKKNLQAYFKSSFKRFK